MNSLLLDLQLFSQKNNGSTHILATSYKGHGVQLAREAAEKYDPVRIFACGGDGTLNEVLQGIIDFPHVELGFIPVGSGNDFSKNFPDRDFFNLNQLIDSPSNPIDIIKASGEFGFRYCINVISMSWDSRVAIGVHDFTGLPLIKGTTAYVLSVVRELLKKKPTRYKVILDGDEIPAKNYMIGMCANGAYYGGGFMGAPLSALDDGLLDLVLVTEITRRGVVKLFPKYQRGEHRDLENPVFKDILTYKKGKELRVISTDPIPLTIDGEEFYTKILDASIIPSKVKLILPKEES